MSQISEYIKYMFLGLIQGIAEILPVSSSGHVAIFSEIIKLNESGMIFEIFTNTASLIALIIIFYQDIINLIKAFFIYIFKKDKREENKEGFNYTLKLLVAAIPIGIVGFIVKDHVDIIKNLLTIGISLFITGSLLILVYLTRNNYKTHTDITFKDSLFIGFSQMFAVIPGISRSGSTYVGGKASKLELKSIIKFSMLLYIIISIPTSILGVYDAVNNSEVINWLGYSLAFVVAFIFTFITGKLVLHRLKVEHFIYFGIYLLLMSSLAITLYLI